MRSALFIVSLAVAGCSGAAFVHTPAVSSTIALTSDDRALWVVTPDADSVSVIDPATRALVAEIALGTAPPARAPRPRSRARPRPPRPRRRPSLRAERQAARARHHARRPQGVRRRANRERR